MVVTTWQQSMLVGSALFQCSAIMENTSGEYKSVVTFQGLSVTQCCCASNRATVNVDVEEGFWFNFQLCLFFYISWFFFTFICHQVWLENVLRANGRVQSKSNSRQEKEAKRIKKEEAAGEADHREDNNKFMKPEQAWTRSDKKFQPQLPPCWKWRILMGCKWSMTWRSPGRMLQFP